MAQRTAHLYLKKGSVDDLEEALADIETQLLNATESERRFEASLVFAAEDSQAVLDALQESFGESDGFQLILSEVAASLPEVEEEQKMAGRVSREELFNSIDDTIQFSWIYLVMTAVSTLIAAFGLIRDDVALIVGSMVIAPLLGPNIALALATTLADFTLLRRAAVMNFIGVLFSLALAFGFGFFFSGSLESEEVMRRTAVTFGDIALALAAGVAGTLAFTTGTAASVVGVMVALALLPPIAVLGMLLGAAQYEASYGTLLLVLTNIICLNLASVVTFFVQGVRPFSWSESENAKRTALSAALLWLVLLGALAILIALSEV